LKKPKGSLVQIYKSHRYSLSEVKSEESVKTEMQINESKKISLKYKSVLK